MEEICDLDLATLGWIKEDRELCSRLKIEAMYDRLVQDQQVEITQIKVEQALEIPKDIDYCNKSLGLSFEEREKLSRVQPQNIAAGENYETKTFFCWFDV